MSATKKKRRLKNINILLCGSWFSFYILQLQQYFEQQWSLSFHLLCMKIRDLEQNISFCIFQSSDANLAVATTSMFCCKQLFWRNYDKPWVILKPTVGKCHFDCFSFHKFTNVVWFYICVIFLFPWAITFFLYTRISKVSAAISSSGELRFLSEPTLSDTEPEMAVTR